MRSYLRSLDPRLTREIYVLEAGVLLNSFGNGVVLPFLIIYLHDVRGIALGTAGLVAATQSVAGLFSGFAGGTLADRVGPKRVLVAALAVMTVAFALMPLIRVAWEAFVLYLAWGAGSGSFWPSQSAMLAALAPAEKRAPAYAIQRLVMNLGVAFGGVVAGFIASVAHPSSFTVLFGIDCVTFLAYMLVLVRVRSPEPHPESVTGSWARVARDRTFVAVTVLNATFIAATIALMVELLPVFAKNTAGVNEREIGTIFALECVGIVVFQLPVTKAVEGRRRMRLFAAMGVLFAVSEIGVWAAGAWTKATVAFVLLAVVGIGFALGECLHATVHGPLAADLAPPQLVGRYLALASISWQVGWIVGPAGGGFLLQHAPLALWPIAACVNLVAAGGALAVERRLPERVRISPRTVPVEPAGIPA
ncbi:MAG TPA: MFS transporter [Gaiellaceae bacterium]|nr:MFS transporter [Gaiellaceae bacterium]